MKNSASRNSLKTNKLGAAKTVVTKDEYMNRGGFDDEEKKQDMMTSLI
jgi:hypothetical protein